MSVLKTLLMHEFSSSPSR